MASKKRIFVFSSNHRVENEHEIITTLFNEGLDYFHIRKFGWSTPKVEELIMKIPEKYHQQIILNSHHHLIKPYQLGGIHVNRDERANKFFLSLKAFYYRRTMPELIISTSYHRISKIQKASSFYSYIFLSSLFGSITKQGVHQYKDKEKLAEFLKESPKYLVALGGIDLINIEQVKEIGFKGVCFHGAIWGYHDPVEKFCKLRDIFLS